jgi:hypothetical protein
MNKYALASIAFIIGRYIGRKDEEGRGKPSVLDFAAAMTPEPAPNAEIPYKLPSLLRWPQWLRPPTPPSSSRSGSEGSVLA